MNFRRVGQPTTIYVLLKKKKPRMLLWSYIFRKGFWWKHLKYECPIECFYRSISVVLTLLLDRCGANCSLHSCVYYYSTDYMLSKVVTFEKWCDHYCLQKNVSFKLKVEFSVWNLLQRKTVSLPKFAWTAHCSP